MAFHCRLAQRSVTSALLGQGIGTFLENLLDLVGITIESQLKQLLVQLDLLPGLRLPRLLPACPHASIVLDLLLGHLHLEGDQLFKLFARQILLLRAHDESEGILGHEALVHIGHALRSVRLRPVLKGPHCKRLLVLVGDLGGELVACSQQQRVGFLQKEVQRRQHALREVVLIEVGRQVAFQIIKVQHQPRTVVKRLNE
mmetsp:Transcript_26095/g.66151  ORF Transcript_26095/g.66151 Transcript_26095/m.66151 type:complete len:200 (-) Transcript_26095:320-919(-)